MNKCFLLFGLLLVLSSFAFADAITSYVVPSSAPLNQPITATGIYADGSGNHPIVLCSFYILDSNGGIMYRATDQYSTSTGRFTMAGWVLSEPTTVRGQSYSLRSECGSVSADANFNVEQKQEAFTILGYSFYPQGGMLDLLYVRDNSLMLFFFFIIVMFFVGLLVLWVSNFT